MERVGTLVVKYSASAYLSLSWKIKYLIAFVSVVPIMAARQWFCVNDTCSVYCAGEGGGGGNHEFIKGIW